MNKLILGSKIRNALYFSKPLDFQLDKFLKTYHSKLDKCQHISNFVVNNLPNDYINRSIVFSECPTGSNIKLLTRFAGGVRCTYTFHDSLGDTLLISYESEHDWNCFLCDVCIGMVGCTLITVNKNEA